MKTITIVMPVYNEEKFVQSAIQTVLASDTLGLKKEIIIVDDCSTDKTKAKIREEIQKNKKDLITLVEKKKNEGKSSVVKSGLIKSKGDIVLVQDADLEYNPEDYPVLLSPFIKQDADVVYGSRFISNRPHRVLYFWHAVMNTFLTTLSNMLTNLNLTDMETGYKVFRGSLIRSIATRLESKRFGFEPEVTARIAKVKGIKIYEVGISYQGRTYEEGKKINWIDGVLALWEIIKYNLITK